MMFAAVVVRAAVRDQVFDMSHFTNHRVLNVLLNVITKCIDHKHFLFSDAWFRTVSGHLSHLHPCKLNVKTSQLCSLTSFRGKEMALAKLWGVGFALPDPRMS